MGLFEFLMVLVSIIIGLGIAEVLTGLARALRCAETVRHHWVHSVLVLAIFIAQLQQWWESWSLRDAPEWTFLALLMMLAGPVCLFLMAHLLFPERLEGANLREYYYGGMRPIWWLGGVAVVAATSFRPLIFGQALFAPDNASSFLTFLGFVLLFRSRREVIHGVVVPAVLLLLVLDILHWTFVIGAG
ncbi:hypothetical protein ACFL5A_00440 [Gemmatimonadota bacterium]